MNNSFFRTDCYVGGAFVHMSDAPALRVTNPATGALLAEVGSCGQNGTERAIQAAAAALPKWSRKPARDRSAALRRMAQVMRDSVEELASLLTAEQGKPLHEARGEIAYAASFVEWFAEEATRVYGETIPASHADQRIFVLRQPIGVCAAITPWNFPSAMLARKVAAALAAGCTIVCKPAEDTPLSGLAWGVIAERAEVPAGVINVITGPPAPIGAALMSSPMVRKVSFTGSTEVGKLLIAQSAATVKKLSLELGGNAPFIVFADADLERALQGAVASKYRNGGQTCVCANRFFVQDEIADDFVAGLVRASRGLVVGDGMRDDVDVGPLINQDAIGKVRRLVEDALGRGARLLCGEAPVGDGLFCEPMVLDGIHGDMAIAQEEIFGPVAIVQRFSEERDVVERANDTTAGLAAYLYTRDGARMIRVSEALEYGIVGVNTGMISTAQAPFGGIKQSGYGREGSRHGIDEYLTMKYVSVAL